MGTVSGDAGSLADATLDGSSDAGTSAEGGVSADGAASDDAGDADTGDADTGDADTGDADTGDAKDDASDGAASDAGDDGASADASDASDGGMTDAGDGSADASGGDAGDSGLGPCGIGNDIREVEPNDTLATATQMPAYVAGVSAICGTLAAGGDADFVQFKVPPTAGHLYWEYTVNVTPVFYVDGVVNDMKVLQVAKPYVVKLVPAAGYTPPFGWTFKVDIN